jgi:hypothetical protein
VTQLAEPRNRPSAPAPQQAYGDRSGRLAVILALVVGLILSGFTQNWASTWKDHNAGGQPTAAERGALGGMDSYALALMLGGLRGPLVMVLWSKVENQKIDRDLDDLDTMIEWIRLLQPEFDTVHIFQIWNKAYNISALMASSGSKYQTILDAIDYARKVDNDRPGDINILDSMARVFAEKLGGKNVTERVFYRRQFREDSMTDVNRKIAYPDDSEHPTRMGFKFLGPKNGPLLDDQNNIDPAFLVPKTPRPAGLAPNSEWNDGSDFQYLARYQPFPYGIAPSALGYNYAKRAQVAMTVGGQHPLQTSDTVVDTRPGLLLKQWSQEESDRGITEETRAFGLPTNADPTLLEETTAAVSADVKIVNPHALESAIYSYGLSMNICDDALTEYHRHLAHPQFINPYQTYTSHLEELKSLKTLSAADRAFLEAQRPGADRVKLLTEAAMGYRAARFNYELLLLKYATEYAVADPLYLSKRIDLDHLNPDDLHGLYMQVIAAVQKVPVLERQSEDVREEYLPYIDRTDARLHTLSAYAAPSVLQIH